MVGNHISSKEVARMVVRGEYREKGKGRLKKVEKDSRSKCSMTGEMVCWLPQKEGGQGLTIVRETLRNRFEKGKEGGKEKFKYKQKKTMGKEFKQKNPFAREKGYGTRAEIDSSKREEGQKTKKKSEGETFR